MMKWTRAPKKVKMFEPMWYTIIWNICFYSFINFQIFLLLWSISWFLSFIFIILLGWLSLCYHIWLPMLEVKFFERKPIKNQIMYHDIWETQINKITENYYIYYVYIWQNWHEMEERIIFITSLRSYFTGI